jgi:WD40 repeat protein
MWDVNTGKVKHVIAAHHDAIYSLAFSPDGLTIASGGGEGTIAFSHFATGQFLFETKVGNRRVRSLQFSPQGTSLVATVNYEGVVLLNALPFESNDLGSPLHGPLRESPLGDPNSANNLSQPPPDAK